MAKKKSEEKAEEKAKEKKLNEKEIENLIIELAKQGFTTEKIGLKLKEKNIPKEALGQRIGKVLRKYNLFEDADIKNLSAEVEKLKRHLAKNPHDFRTKRTLFIKEAKLHKLERYRKNQLK